MADEFPTVAIHIDQRDDFPQDVRYCDICPPVANCHFDFSASGGKTISGGSFLEFILTFTGICVPTDRTLNVAWDAYSVVGNQFIVRANGVIKYDSGCQTGSGSGTAVIPAGTTTVTYSVQGGCNVDGGDLWILAVTCA